MNKKGIRNLIYMAAVLFFGGVITAVLGVYGIDDSSKPAYKNSNSTVQTFEPNFQLKKVATTVFGTQYIATTQTDPSNFQETSGSDKKGVTVGQIMRGAGIVAVVLAVIILLCIEFFYKHQVKQRNYRLLLVICLLVMPIIVGMGATATVLETTKTVQSCNSCHVMHPFVNDLKSPESTTLAARHFKNKWIPKNQCYTCHTTYGAHGTLEGKRDGFRHWLLYVTETWQEPIQYSGTYPNSNCINCHGGTKKFVTVESHQALFKKLKNDEVNCTDCHGPTHPLPDERKKLTEDIKESSNATLTIPKKDLASLKEFINEIK